MLTPTTHETPITHGASTYRRDTYAMTRYELTAPAVCNDGTPSDYPRILGQRLAAAAYGWTSVASRGCWQGRVEDGETFTLYADADRAADLARIARECMPDQDAVQLVIFPTPITLVEA